MIDITINEIIKNLKNSLQVTFDNFTSALKSINPNKIDIDKLKSITVANKPLKAYDGNEVLIYPQGKSVTIKISAEKLKNAILKAIKQENFDVREDDDVLHISIPQLTKQDRENLAKDIKDKKEKIKQKINDFRGNAMTLAKKLPKSDKEKTEKEIEKIKDDFYSKLEILIQNKIKEIL